MYLERSVSNSKSERGNWSRAEIEGVRARHPIEQVIAEYAPLRRSGRVLMAHCPLPGHDDTHPSFAVYVDDQHFYCFGCERGGDVFTFVELVEQVSFPEAVERLEARAHGPSRHKAFPAARMLQSTPSPPARHEVPRLSAQQKRILTVTATVYHNSLLTHRDVLESVLSRGISMDLVRRFRLGYATGDELAEHLAVRGLDLDVAKGLGLLDERGEFFEKRIIFPERRSGRVLYLIGRATDPAQELKYLGLRGVNKPLYGLALVRHSREVFLVEGPFDWLTLVQWGYPAVALLGSHMKAEWVAQLHQAERVYIVTDSDDAGRAAAQRLAETFGERAIIVPPLPDARDVNELGQHADGAAHFMELVRLGEISRQPRRRARRHLS